MDIAKGKFERTSAENYDELLKVLDVNMILRKAATASTPVMEVRLSKKKALLVLVLMLYLSHDQ